MPSEKLTEAVFASQAAGLASAASSWAFSILVPPDKLIREADPEAVARFSAEMRARLDFPEELSGRQALAGRDQGEGKDAT